MKKIDCDGVYTIAEKLGIEITNVKMKERIAFIGPEGYLNIDYSKIKTQAEELAILLEEVEHFSMQAFYTVKDSSVTWAKQEARVKRRIFEKYYPAEKLARLMAAGHSKSWQLAETLSLPESFVKEMLAFYADVRQVDFNQLAKTQPRERLSKKEAFNKFLEDIYHTHGVSLAVSEDATSDDVNSALDRIAKHQKSLVDDER